MQTCCRCSQQLRRHINDYVDTFWKLWRLLTPFKGTIRQKKVFGCVNTSNSNNLKVWKLQSNIFAKMKKFAKPFIHMGPRSNLLSRKNGQKSSDTFPLRSIFSKKSKGQKIKINFFLENTCFKAYYIQKNQMLSTNKILILFFYFLKRVIFPE